MKTVFCREHEIFNFSKFNLEKNNMKNKLLLLILPTLLCLSINCKTQTLANEQGKSKRAETGSINTIRGLNISRAAHTATLLNNGKVLIAGGFSGGDKGLTSTEIFDPKTNSFSYAKNMSVARASHSATLLPDGKVLIAGGYNGEYLDSAEVYDPKTGKFTQAAKMTMPRSEHVAVLLDNGKVLLIGGVGTGWTFLADAEIYDPSTNTFTKTGSMTTARESHTATLLKDGQVLITGGHKDRRSAIKIYSSAEIYNPSNGTFTKTANLNVKRHKHDAVLLKDGRVLIVGGSDERDAGGAYTSVEIFNPKTKTFAKIGDMNLSRYKLRGTSILQKDGKVLILGGATQAEIFDPADKTFEVATGDFESRRLFSTATLLQNGQVLIVGGYDTNITVGKQAWIY